MAQRAELRCWPTRRTRTSMYCARHRKSTPDDQQARGQVPVGDLVGNVLAHRLESANEQTFYPQRVVGAVTCARP
jgi:hypothetical protein